MSRAYRCDKCGKLSKFSLVTIEGSIIQFSTFELSFSVEKKRMSGKDYPRVGKLELCKECAEPLKKFLFSWWWNDE
jgi:hypothetical protein